MRSELEEQIARIGDLERLISRVSVGRIVPREVVQLKNALSAILPVKEICSLSDEPYLQRTGEQLNPCLLICNRIEKELQTDAPVQINRGNIIAPGVSPELDELQDTAQIGKGLPPANAAKGN